MKPTQFAIAAAVLVLTGCSGLPRSTRQEITLESEKLDQAKFQLKRVESTVKEDLAKVPDLFNGTPVATEWPARLAVAKTKLERAEDARKQLEKIRSGDRAEVDRAERLLSEEHRMRQLAMDEAAAVEGEANRWLDFQRNLPHYLAKIQQEHDQIKALDIAPVAQIVEKAGRDWPAKKADLDSRLNAIRSTPEKAELQWQATEALRQTAVSGKLAGPQIATLIEADTLLADAATGLTRNTDNLKALSGQLYDSWDKVLEDLEVSNEGREPVYREKLKTVRTHFTDVAEKKTETSSDVKWVNVSPVAYRAVERDLGMAVSHKDAGLYDSEAQNVAQPAGYAYIASPEVGRNQYGYWSRNEGGSFWTFLPEYLIMRELLWGRGGYQPVMANQYNTFHTYQREGRSWYGQETPQAAPKYGTTGTFTQKRYGDSRYVQSGGFKSSAFSSNPSAPAAGRTFGTQPNDSSQGRRFGKSSEEPSQGRRFGGGGSSAEPPSGRRFGGGSGASPRFTPRSAPRGFGRRR
jgi:hypothetical protein